MFFLNNKLFKFDSVSPFQCYHFVPQWTSGEGNFVDEKDNIGEETEENEEEEENEKEEKKECGFWDWGCNKAQGDGVQNDYVNDMEYNVEVAVSHGRSVPGGNRSRRRKRDVKQECEGITGAVQASMQHTCNIHVFYSI